MKVVYLIPPGTRVAVSSGDDEFRVQTSPQLQFTDAPELTDTHAVFTHDKLRFRVARADVIVSQYDGQGGSNQFGI